MKVDKIIRIQIKIDRFKQNIKMNKKNVGKAVFEPQTGKGLRKTYFYDFFLVEKRYKR